MKYFFIVQGEGRGHLTQSISLKEMLERNGHEVVAIWVGKSDLREIPNFYNQRIKMKVESFDSPNFLPAPNNKRPPLYRSIIYNTIRIKRYAKSLFRLKKAIEESGADCVINFYEMMAGLTYGFLRPSVPMICIGHQYLFLQPNFAFPKESNKFQIKLLNFLTRITALNAHQKLALSFYDSQSFGNTTVVPPLLRKELRRLQPTTGSYIHGYMINSGYAEEIVQWNAEHPFQPLHFFREMKSDTPIHPSPTLNFHALNDELFLLMMADCKAYATTGGFESVCEAIYLGKPVLMVPIHVEQECNAWDALRTGAGVISNSFNLNKLIDFIPEHQPNKNFKAWANSAERLIIEELESVGHCHPQVYMPLPTA